MIAAIFRFVKRSLVFLPGIVLSYFAVKKIYPEVHEFTPGVLAIFITYLIIAYGVIPASIRGVRIFFRPKHIPLYSTTPDGFASDPINIGIVGTKDELTRVMQKAGWHAADKRSVQSLYKLFLSYAFKQSYPTAPFSRLYLFGRPQDIGFQQAAGKDISRRHHVRFWATDLPASQEHSKHLRFWRRHAQKSTSGKTLWVGAALLDNGLGIVRHNAQLTHHIHPDTNAERDMLVKQLRSTGQVKSTKVVRVGTPYQLRNRVINGYLNADGKMTICEL